MNTVKGFIKEKKITSTMFRRWSMGMAQELKQQGRMECETIDAEAAVIRDIILRGEVLGKRILIAKLCITFSLVYIFMNVVLPEFLAKGIAIGAMFPFVILMGFFVYYIFIGDGVHRRLFSGSNNVINDCKALEKCIENCKDADYDGKLIQMAQDNMVSRAKDILILETEERDRISKAFGEITTCEIVLHRTNIKVAWEVFQRFALMDSRKDMTYYFNQAKEKRVS